MAEGFVVRVTHSGTSRNPILLSDVESDSRFDAYRGPGPVYVPVGGAVELIYSSTVAISFEKGDIRKFKDGGYITTEFISGDAIWDPTVETQDYYLDGVSGDDSNDGLSSSTPVKSWSRIEEIIPNPIFNQTVTVHMIGDYDCDVSGVIDPSGLSMLGDGYLNIEGTLTQTATGTLTDADPDGDVWAVEDGAAAFTADDEGRVLRFTSGGDSGTEYHIAEVLSGTKIRLADAGFGSAPWSTDDYEILDYDTTITRPSVTGPAVGIDEYRPKHKIRLHHLRLRGAVKFWGGFYDVDICTVEENGNANRPGLVFKGGARYTVRAYAKPSGGAPPAGSKGFVFESSQCLAYNFSGEWGSWTAAKDWPGSGVHLYGCHGPESPRLSSIDCEIKLRRSAVPWPFVKISGDTFTIALGHCTLARVILYDGLMLVSGATVEWNLFASAYYTTILDGQSSAATVLKLTNGASLSTTDGGTVTIKDTTGDAIVLDPGSSLSHNGSIEISNAGGIGLNATGSRVNTVSDDISIDSCTSDGARFTNCTGAVDLDSDNNGGWGAQFLKATQMHDLGSTFAGNTSGATNVDGSSNFVA